MADQTITPKDLALNAFSELAAGDYEDLTVANQGVVALPKDGRYVLHFIDAAGGAVVTITHGDGVMAGQGDLVSAALTQNLHNFLTLDSARFKWGTGDDKGLIRITTSANIKVACVKLP